MSNFIRTTAINRIANMKQRIKVVQGGQSAGKTIAILALLINKALQKSDLIIDVVAITYNHLDTGAITDFKRIMNMTKRWEDKRWNSTKHIYTFHNNTQLRFIALDKPMKARGPRRNILYVNEANLIPFETYYNLASRTSDDIYIDFNPTNNFWAHDEVLTKSNTEFIKLTYRDNEGIPKNSLDEMLENRTKALTSDYWKNWCKVYLDGEVGSLEGVIFTNWKRIDTIPIEANLIGYGMDWGFADDPTTLVALYKYDGKIIIDELIYKQGLVTNEIATLIKLNTTNETIYADSSELRLISELKAKGINIRSVKKGPGSVIQGIQIMQNYEFLITNKSTNTIKELETYSWLNKGNKTEPIDSFNHCIDAIRYCVWMKLGMKDSNGSKEVYSFNF